MHSPSLPTVAPHPRHDPSLVRRSCAPAGSVLPPVLAAYLPPALSQRRQDLEQGGWLQLSTKQSDAAPLRGALALLLRSVAAPDSEHKYTSLAAGGDPPAVTQWRCQCRRLLLCCAALLGGEPGPRTDLLLQAAAARAVAVLLDELQWKCYPAGPMLLSPDPLHAEVGFQADLPRLALQAGR